MKKAGTVASHLVVLILLCCVLCLSAHADMSEIVQPGSNDIQEREAVEIAADFFAIKCGTTKEALLNAEWECYFGNVSKYEANTAEPHWTLVIHHVTNSDGDDPWVHLIVLSRKGELLYWEAHSNMGYTVAEPDLLSGATYAQPLGTDAQEEDIIQATREALITAGAYSPADILTFQAHFMYHEQFNQGTIPAWLAYVEREGSVEWKALYGYNGYAISLVPYQQDFTDYELPGERFWDYAFGEGSNEVDLLLAIQDGSMPLEERVVQTDRWRPYVERWIEEHPYYMNDPGYEYDITILNRFGVPDEKTLTQAEATTIARREAVRLGCFQSTVETRRVKVYYYVTDPNHPVWEIFLGRIQVDTMSTEEQKIESITNGSTCTVKIDAYSGTVVDSVLKKPSEL